MLLVLTSRHPPAFVGSQREMYLAMNRWRVSATSSAQPYVRNFRYNTE